MSQISQPETVDLLSKLLTERIPVRAFLVSQTGTRSTLSGFVDSVTRDDGLIVSRTGPPIDVSQGYIAFFPFDCDCEFWYGEVRELPAELRPTTATRGESALLFRIPSGDRLSLFFTL